MRALLWLDVGASRVSGHVVQGHIVQAERTAAALRRLGVNVDVTPNPEAAVHDYDVVHGFGAHRSLLRKARVAGVPVVLSSVYWSADYVLGETQLGRWPQHRSRQLARRLRVTRSVFARGAGTTAMTIARPLLDRSLDFETADLLLPNSEAEAHAIRLELGVSTPCHVVPNGVDPTVFHLPEPQVPRDQILCVARIEPHKNQLTLLRAMRSLPFPLTLVGPPHPHHEAYVAACQKLSGPRVTFEVAKSHEELLAFYQRARVHVLPSFFETTGLVSLEAALSGCAVASTNRGFAHEYLLDHAEYLDPADPKSIASAIQRAWERADDAQLRERILTRFTWDDVAKATIEGYQRVLSAPKNGV